MENYKIADTLSLLSKLMEIHNENSFKAKTYATAAFTIDRFPGQLKELSKEKISSIKGIGNSTALKIFELFETGKIDALEQLISKTPAGILEMMKIKGLGPKKINCIWKEMEIESVGELLYACKENRLKLFKGFGEKTQDAICEKIEFYQKAQGSFLYAQTEDLHTEISGLLHQIFGKDKIYVTGEFARQLEVITAFEFVVISDIGSIKAGMKKIDAVLLDESQEFVSYDLKSGIKTILFPSTEETKYDLIIRHSSTAEFFSAFAGLKKQSIVTGTESEYFQDAGIPFIPAFLREDPDILEIKEPLEVIEVQDIKGIIHCHSDWSDGNNTIEQLAKHCISSGLEYLVVSDHSKSAFYAQGLSEERIIQQQDLIDQLNNKLHPFRIFKGIESDILGDGSLDYSEEMLKRFDLIIASVHSNLKMSREKATERLLKAIENPYTTILGHMTGRLLLSRAGYPVDHKRIIDACIERDVVIELNSHPNRLDIDWRQIGYAINRGALISINPDAHYIEGLKDVRYGVKVAQKANVKKEQNLSSFSLHQLEAFLKKRKQVRIMK